MITADSIIDDLGGTGRVAAALALSDNTVSTWRARGAIPAAHWLPLVRFAAEAGREVTLEILAELAARERSVAEAARA